MHSKCLLPLEHTDYMSHYAWFVKRRLQEKIVIKLEQHQGGERGFLGFFFLGGVVVVGGDARGRGTPAWVK